MIDRSLKPAEPTKTRPTVQKKEQEAKKESLFRIEIEPKSGEKIIDRDRYFSSHLYTA
jgi:hypothetical protein